MLVNLSTSVSSRVSDNKISVHSGRIVKSGTLWVDGVNLLFRRKMKRVKKQTNNNKIKQ